MDNGSILRSASLTEWDSNPALDDLHRNVTAASAHKYAGRASFAAGYCGTHAAVSSGQATSEFDHNVVQLPREIPKSIAMVRDEAPPPGNAFGIDGDVPGGIPVGATAE